MDAEDIVEGDFRLFHESLGVCGVAIRKHPNAGYMLVPALNCKQHGA